MLLTYTALFKDGASKQKQRIERRISNGTRPNSAEYDFSCVQQIARTDRFVRVLTTNEKACHNKQKDPIITILLTQGTQVQILKQRLLQNWWLNNIIRP